MNNKIKNITNTILFFSIFVLFFLINIFYKDKEISNSERRKLKQFPVVSWKDIVNTKFMDDFDEYVLDQFIFRDSFRKVKTYVEFDLLNKKDNNNLFVIDGYIFKNLYPLNLKNVEFTANKITSIYEKYLKDMNVYYTIIPDKNYYLDKKSDYLRIDYDKLTTTMNKKINNIKYIDIFNTLKLDSYYKTDIHWRQDKLQDTALTISKAMDIKIAKDYEKKTIKGFEGSYFGQIASSRISKDNITYLINDIISNATVFNYETNEHTSIYDLNKINSVDKYDVFLSGPAALLEISNPKATTSKELIVFRDSFGSSLIPLLIQDYKKITVVDIRYINSNYLNKFISFEKQDVLFMYSVNIINNSTVLK